MPEHPTRRWLRLERLGAGEAEIDQALQKVMGLLPVYAPSPGFSSRVIGALGGARVIGALGGARAHWVDHWAARVAVAFCLVQGGLLLGLLPVVLARLGAGMSVADLIATAVRSAAQGIETLDPGLRLGRNLLDALSTVGEVLTTPTMALVLAGCLLTAGVALVILASFSSVRRGPLSASG